MNKIYDCFNFFNELDILEIRLNVLYNFVDYFVIIESDVTHSGEKKPFYFDEHKERFHQFSDKIINYRIDDTPDDFVTLPQTDDHYLKEVYDYIITQNRFDRCKQPDYGRDFFQKESVRRALKNCDDDDLIIVSDADEIPNPAILQSINCLDLEQNIYALEQCTYYYYLNVLKQRDWYGSRIGKYKNIKNKSLNEIRNDQRLSEKLQNGGWHFSFMGGLEMVKRKITSYSARDLASTTVIANLEKNIEYNIDPFFRGELFVGQIDESYPAYILNNLEKYKPMIKIID